MEVAAALVVAAVVAKAVAVREEVRAAEWAVVAQAAEMVAAREVVAQAAWGRGMAVAVAAVVEVAAARVVVAMAREAQDQAVAAVVHLVGIVVGRAAREAEAAQPVEMVNRLLEGHRCRRGDPRGHRRLRVA